MAGYKIESLLIHSFDTCFVGNYSFDPIQVIELLSGG